MTRNHKIDARFAADEIAQIDRICKSLNMPRSQYLRLCSTGGISQNALATKTQASTFDDSALREDLDEMKKTLDRVRDEISNSAKSFDALLNQLSQILRISSFREYRAKAAVDGFTPQPGEQITDVLIRLAESYFLQTEIWPNVSDQRTFGDMPQGFDQQIFNRAGASRFAKSQK